MRARVVAAAHSFRRSAAPRAAPSSPGGRSRPSRRCACSSPWTSRSCCWRSARGRSSSASRRRRSAGVEAAAARRRAVLEPRHGEVPQRFGHRGAARGGHGGRRRAARRRQHRLRALADASPTSSTRAPPRAPLRDRRLRRPAARARGFLRRHANATPPASISAPIRRRRRRAAAAAPRARPDLRRRPPPHRPRRAAAARAATLSSSTCRSKRRTFTASTCERAGSPSCPTRCGCWTTAARRGASSSTARRAPRYPWPTAPTSRDWCELGTPSWPAPSSSAALECHDVDAHRRWCAATVARASLCLRAAAAARRRRRARRQPSPPT